LAEAWIQAETNSPQEPHSRCLQNPKHIQKKDLDEYFDAKKNIFMNQDAQDFAVLNAKCKRTNAIVDEIQPKILYFNNESRREVITSDNPNYWAVLEVARALGIDDQHCRSVFESFKGVEHRLEWVRNLAGVDFINDSKSTTAEASQWALEHIEKPIVMICGGRDKNIDYSVLGDLVKKKVKKMVVIGEARQKIREALESFVAIDECEELRQAVDQARHVSAEGDCVVLSPMCASFDMFQNFEERGKVFKQIVKNLK